MSLFDYSGAFPMTSSPAMAEIWERKRESFRRLASNLIKKSTLDEFESFLKVDDVLTRPSLIIRCQVSNRQCDVRVVVDKPISQRRLSECFLPFLHRTLPRTYSRSDFFVLLSDSLYISSKRKAEFVAFLENAPLLRCDYRDDDEVSSRSIIIPDFWIQDSKYVQELIAIGKAAKETAFEQRFEVIKWRGSLSGQDYANPKNPQDFARFALLMMSLKHPDMIDARLTNYDVSAADSKSAAALRRRLEEIFGGPAEELPANCFVPYKYLISIDGAVAAWKRVPTILASGSVLLLQHRWNQFFYPGLKPWRHYVPLKDDISDLIERYDWLRAHPQEAKILAENGQHFAEEVLSPRALETYFVEIVNTCSELYSA